MSGDAGPGEWRYDETSDDLSYPISPEFDNACDSILAAKSLIGEEAADVLEWLLAYPRLAALLVEAGRIQPHLVRESPEGKWFYTMPLPEQTLYEFVEGELS